jgi:GNAT superfamily N-acetyltransferase
MYSFTLSKDISDDDWEPLFIIDMHAFKNNPEIMAFSPGGLDPKVRDRNVTGFKAAVFGGQIERAYAKITETTSGEITSFISARVYRGSKGLIDGDLAAEPPALRFPFIDDAIDRRFYEWYWNINRRILRGTEQLQVPHVFIQALGTDPKWQRNGAASMLVRWLVDFVSKQKIGRCALQASPLAMELGFYEKLGFRVISRQEFVDEDQFPGRKGTPQVLMIQDI